MSTSFAFPPDTDLPLRPAVAREAAQWFVQLSSGEASEADRRACEGWRRADPEHERAWQRTQRLGQQFAGLAPGAGLAALDRTASPASRRRAVKQLAAVLVLGVTGVAAYRHSPWRAADHRTATGERRTVTLADGSTLHLNTASAVDVRFTPTERRLRLLHGEVFIETAREPGPYRPLRVETAEGVSTALGTRFSLRQLDGLSRLGVEEGAVEVHLQAVDGGSRIVRAGQAATFARDHVVALAALDDTQLAWRHGALMADRMPLGQFVAELSRHRPGVLRCDPAVAGLEISGSFPLADTDRVLQSLVDTLPVRVTLRTRYWVQVGPS
jgi:transmembrane sensor